MNTLPAQTWVDQIAAAWDESRRKAIHTGQLLLLAKTELPHGEFQAMIEAQLPFGTRTANMLMQVAGDSRITNEINAPKLPNSWRTLYELTRLNDSAWEAGMDQGLITPDMERSQVQQISKITSNIQPADPEAKQLKALQYSWNRASKRVRDEFVIWTQEQNLKVFNLRSM